ncbi:MAG: hypothetical protein ABSG52_00385 [Terriglobales bacterium]|jgi:hypothetical protein
MAALRFPANPKDTLACADWLELTALISDERNTSISGLERNLRRLGVYERSNQTTIEEDAAIEAACGAVFSELTKRAHSAGPAYPFTFAESQILVAGPIENYSPYVFCLCLSWFGWKQRKGRKTFPRRMFEDLSRHAAQAFIGGRALRFGSPRVELPPGFKKAVVQLCVEIREGEARQVRERISSQDDKLDVIAWRGFPDGAEGKLFLVGQCASGGDWDEKKSELDIKSFFEDWFSETPPSPMTKAFFVPHRIPREKWKRVTRRAGIIFDRCRIAYWSDRSTEFTDRTTYSDWSNKTLAAIHIL